MKSGAYPLFKRGQHSELFHILWVPSVVARLDHDVLINPAHPEFALINASLHQPVYWDRRLFGT